MATLTAAEKFDIIKENLDEILNPEIIEKILTERDLKIYWGESRPRRHGGQHLDIALAH